MGSGTRRMRIGAVADSVTRRSPSCPRRDPPGSPRTDHADSPRGLSPASPSPGSPRGDPGEGDAGDRPRGESAWSVLGEPGGSRRGQLGDRLVTESATAPIRMRRVQEAVKVRHVGDFYWHITARGDRYLR